MQSIHHLLPQPLAQEIDYPDNWFYNNIAKYFIEDTIRITNNGIPIDMKKVNELDLKLISLLNNIQYKINNSKVIINFQKQKEEQLKEQYRKEIQSKLKTADDFKTSFNHKSVLHRSYVMYIYTKQNTTISLPKEEIVEGIPKWLMKDIKQLNIPYLNRLFSGKINNSKLIEEGMNLLAQHKANIYNKRYLDKLNSIQYQRLVPEFNCKSPPQKQELFKYLGIKSPKVSKRTGQDSFDKYALEELANTTADEEIAEILHNLLEYSLGAVIKNNFITAFNKYTLNNRLYGNLNLGGAKTFRYTSDHPNLLNMPSSGSIYAKPIKKCFNAPKGYIVTSADFAALEDRVIASISKDKNKCAIFLDGLDGHCLNAIGYFADEINKYMKLSGDIKNDTKLFKQLIDDGHKDLKKIRQKSKPITFGLSYGAYPPKISEAAKIPLDIATDIFNNYHYKLYPGITEYREQILYKAKTQGYIHLGLGYYIKTDNPEKDIRTLFNATIQFWSILTLFAIHEMHYRIDKEHLNKDIQCISTIYDSVYYICRNDVNIIKWLNDNLIEVMVKEYLIDQIVPNEANMDIGYNWYNLYTLPNKATKEQIQDTLKQMKRSRYA